VSFCFTNFIDLRAVVRRLGLLMKFERKHSLEAGGAWVWVILIIALLALAVYLVSHRPEW